MESKPLVSVLMTAYNREELIKDAIESVLKSSYKNLEIIIVDDCSQDKTLEVIQFYAEKDARIKYYQNEKNIGDYPNRNRAASYATGEYFTFLDSDDKMFQDGLDNCINAMLQFPDAGMGMYWGKSKGKPFMIEKGISIHRHFLEEPFLIIGPGGTVLKRSFFESIKGYPEKYGPANDMYFNLKVACQTDIVCFPFEFFFYRAHSNRESNNWYSYISNNYTFLKDALIELPLQLTPYEKKWVANKNKRRFVLTLIRYFFFTGNLKKIAVAIRTTRFSTRDLFNAIFQ